MSTAHVLLVDDEALIVAQRVAGEGDGRTFRNAVLDRGYETPRDGARGHHRVAREINPEGLRLCVRMAER